MNIRTWSIKIVLVLMLMLQCIFPAQAKTQDVTSLPPGMHNYTQQGMAFYDLNGAKINHNTSHIFKGAKLRWGDFNNDGLDDFVILSGDRKDSFLIRNAANKNFCIDVHGASAADGAKIIAWKCHGGVNQLWHDLGYAALATKLIVYSHGGRAQACMEEINGKLHSGPCNSTKNDHFLFLDDGTISEVSLAWPKDYPTINFGRVTAKASSGENISVGTMNRGKEQQWRKDFGNMKLRVFLNSGEVAGSQRFNQVREFDEYYDLPHWGDFDGNGKLELLLSHAPMAGQDQETQVTGLDQVTYVVPAYSLSDGVSDDLPYRHGKILAVGDFDGDSKDDMLYYDQNELTILPSKYH